MSIFQFIIPPLPHFLFCGEDTYFKDNSHPNRRNIGLFDLIVVTQGTLYISEEDLDWIVEGGNALILRPDKYHFSTKPCIEETHFYWLHFQSKGDWLEVDEESSTFYGNSHKNPFYQDELFYLYLPRFCRLDNSIQTFERFRKLLLFDNQVTPKSRWQEQLIFQEILQDLNRSQNKKASSTIMQIAEKAVIFLQKNYKNPLTYEKLGYALNFHPTYVTRCMKQVFDCTPLEYLTRYRIEQSKLLLVNTDLPIGHIAEEVGFSSISYYSRCFAKLVQLTPVGFRKQYR